MTAFRIAIEGGDGVGKNTVSKAVASQLTALGYKPVVVNYPQYQETLAGAALGQFLSEPKYKGTDLKAVATLFALDRREHSKQVQELSATADVVIFDRYIASNVAYQSAKVPMEEREALMAWIANLETEVLEIPKADLNILLRLDYSEAKELISKKDERSYTSLTYDLHEADKGLQDRLRGNYTFMAENHILGDWLTVDVSDGPNLIAPSILADKIVSHITPFLSK